MTSQMTSKITSKQELGLMSSVVWVDEWRSSLWYLIIIFIIIFVGLGIFINNVISGMLTSRWYMSSIKDSESIYTSFIFDGVGFSVIANVAVLSDSVVTTT